MVRKAQALISVLFLLLLASVLAGTLATIWSNELQTRSLESGSLNAFYLAQAGIEEGKIWAKNTPGGSINGVFLSLSGGRYNFSVDGPARTISATGQSINAAGTLIAERQLTLRFKADYSGQEDKSWRER